ncbi:MAG: alcohol dehydrogenase catalytic domain-containing protein [Eggerthellaceae bacterium]|nr:alcohol dehydrogenase catalytic domain-containing protein [Eggerthellaceae bacterium]
MLNCVYRLVAPRTIEPVEAFCDLAPGCVVVRPTHLSICNADQRYYQGNRSARVLAEKLPMALIHEGIGRVLHDPTGIFAPGARVVMLPNEALESDEFIAENYLESSRFCGSGYDGFMQEVCVLPAKRVLALPDGIHSPVAAFTELVSVAVHAVTRFEAIAHERRDVVGVWGDGNVGFITALVLHVLYPDMRVAVFGRNPYKLADFTFAETYLTSEADRAPRVDHAFECCGGEGAVSAIEQIIGQVKPEGAIALLGVSENPVPVNTRMVLEKGLRLFGSSRSGRSDFERTLALYRANPEIVDYLRTLVATVVPVSSIKDMTDAFSIDARKPMGKTVMRWDV